jgi:Rrf2 family transcriptional regulator, iron-sulfur cluster assembly transcription factor
MVSQSSRYAIRALVLLADRDGEGPLSAEEIARELEVPRNYLSKLLHILTARGLLSSRKGPGGGFALGAPPSRITLAQVVDTFEPADPEGAARCLLSGGRCSDGHPCAAHDHWKEVAGAYLGFFRRTTLDDLRETGPGTRPE